MLTKILFVHLVHLSFFELICKKWIKAAQKTNCLRSSGEPTKAHNNYGGVRYMLLLFTQLVVVAG